LQQSRTDLKSSFSDECELVAELAILIIASKPKIVIIGFARDVSIQSLIAKAIFAGKHSAPSFCIYGL
jgi:hypothetical protein